VIASRSSILLIAAFAASIGLTRLAAPVQWWRIPADFEDCADKAEKAASKEERASGLSECNAKFAGRRKSGGGYAYFDFMQNRSFDIAGPNPTAAEQRKIDEQYTNFLDQERRSRTAAEFNAKQQLLLQASVRNETIPLPIQAPTRPQAPSGEIRSSPKPANCVQDSFSCNWPRLSESITDFKKLFSSPFGRRS